MSDQSRKNYDHITINDGHTYTDNTSITAMIHHESFMSINKGTIVISLLHYGMYKWAILVSHVVVHNMLEINILYSIINFKLLSHGIKLSYNQIFKVMY